MYIFQTLIVSPTFKQIETFSVSKLLTLSHSPLFLKEDTSVLTIIMVKKWKSLDDGIPELGDFNSLKVALNTHI